MILYVTPLYNRYPSMEERIKDIAIKNATIVIVTESNRIFRWR